MHEQNTCINPFFPFIKAFCSPSCVLEKNLLTLKTNYFDLLFPIFMLLYVAESHATCHLGVRPLVCVDLLMFDQVSDMGNTFFTARTGIMFYKKVTILLFLWVCGCGEDIRFYTSVESHNLMESHV